MEQVQVSSPALPGYTGPVEGLFGFLHHDRAWGWSHDVNERIIYVRDNKSKAEVEVRLRHIVYLSPGLLEAAGVPLEVLAEGGRLWAESGRLRAEGGRLLAESSRLWAEGNRLWAEGDRLWAEGDRLWDESDQLRTESNRLWTEGDRLRTESNRLLVEGGRLLAESSRLWAEGDRLLVPYSEVITALVVSLVPDCRWTGTELDFSTW